MYKISFYREPEKRNESDEPMGNKVCSIIPQKGSLVIPREQEEPMIVELVIYDAVSDTFHVYLSYWNHGINNVN